MSIRSPFLTRRTEQPNARGTVASAVVLLALWVLVELHSEFFLVVGLHDLVHPGSDPRSCGGCTENTAQCGVTTVVGVGMIGLHDGW